MQEYNIEELLKKDNARIRWVNYGTANCFIYEHKDKKFKLIEINKDLLDDTYLFNYVLNHELKHSKELYSKEDASADIPTSPKGVYHLFTFFLQHPTSWHEALPIYKTKKQGWVFDINLIGLYTLGLIVGIFLKI